ncbi:MAG: chromate resistance protein, partial [Rubrivivax sp.]|nr:chromate resistance protein [Rubrivivax sp.]
YRGVALQAAPGQRPGSSIAIASTGSRDSVAWAHPIGVGPRDPSFSRGEPVARAAHGIPRLDPRKFQGKRWATRARPWVDRLACAWLIREAAGLEAVLAGLREVHADDDHLGLAAAAVFDALHAAPGTPT